MSSSGDTDPTYRPDIRQQRRTHAHMLAAALQMTRGMSDRYPESLAAALDGLHQYGPTWLKETGDTRAAVLRAYVNDLVAMVAEVDVEGAKNGA